MKAVTPKSSPLCRTCKYHSMGKCKLFFEQNVRLLSYASTSEVRLDEKLCGPDGKYWVEAVPKVLKSETSDW
jgi:hypothetical protein